MAFLLPTRALCAASLLFGSAALAQDAPAPVGGATPVVDAPVDANPAIGADAALVSGQADIKTSLTSGLTAVAVAIEANTAAVDLQTSLASDEAERAKIRWMRRMLVAPLDQTDLPSATAEVELAFELLTEDFAFVQAQVEAIGARRRLPRPTYVHIRAYGVILERIGTAIDNNQPLKAFLLAKKLRSKFGGLYEEVMVKAIRLELVAD